MSVEPFNKFENLGVAKHTGNALINGLWPQYQSLETSVTFTNGTNENGDYNGTGNPSDLFTVTGTVELVLIAICTTNLAGSSATIEVGTSTNSASLIAQTTGTDIDAGEIWHDASPDSTIEESSVYTRKIVNEDVIISVGTADLSAGVIKFILYWTPISSDGDVVVA